MYFISWELIFVYGVKQNPASFPFLPTNTNFGGTIYWLLISFPINTQCELCHVRSLCARRGLFLSPTHFHTNLIYHRVKLSLGTNPLLYSVTPLLGMYLGEMRAHSHQWTLEEQREQQFGIIASNWKYLNSKMEKLYYIQIMASYTVTKRR